ncbi:LysR family transcriptional regulator [Enterococcus faecalis]|uniref:LysR family transcriptional regulator n=1 Tax=Enterococcus faecalis TaxID=1351 RepID=UPI000353CD4B|nr:LysR family transcriptional regulator [Enterococcus faecalis]EPI22890.1 LysR substrate binding domain protein [Enterococcus faecalis]EPI26868.1 LysR substrate binding domain protein [Enterococcus faecalis WKS-26-18-2]UYY18569.1 LysR family transcriptional regulator [Enterococcus faecalis]UYY21142.1 LysR family transcriptional regulator [Enterococcus faecalis]
MNIQLLKYFIEIVNTRSLSAAARNLFVTQPTLSLALKKMESELGTALFDHSDQPFQLTHTGLYLYEHGQEVVFQFDQLVTDIREMNQKPVKKQLRLGLTTLFAVQFMKEISRFLTTHPHVNLILQQDGSPKLQTMLANKEIDMGLISFPNTLPEIIHIELLETTTKGYHVYVVVPESNPLSQYEKLTFKDLKDQRFSSLSDNFMIGRLLLDRTRSFGYEPNIILHNDDLQVLLYSLQKNNSICLLPIEYYEVGKSQGLKWIPLKDKFDYFPIGIALRRDFSMTEDVRDFIQIIKEN